MTGVQKVSSALKRCVWMLPHNPGWHQQPATTGSWPDPRRDSVKMNDLPNESKLNKHQRGGSCLKWKTLLIVKYSLFLFNWNKPAFCINLFYLLKVTWWSLAHVRNDFMHVFYCWNVGTWYMGLKYLHTVTEPPFKESWLKTSLTRQAQQRHLLQS